MNFKRATIKDVADLAKVSVGTVSRALNESGYVGKEAKDKIESAVKELNYIPNSAARSMVNKKSHIVGVAVPEINNPFLADLFVKIEAGLSLHSYSILLCNTHYKQEKIVNFIDDLAMRNAEGVILIATDIHKSELIEKMNNYLFVVTIGQHIEQFDCVNYDDYGSAYRLANHLISIGHEKIAFMGYNEYASQTMSRLRGYIAALTDAGLPLREEYQVHSDGSENAGYNCAKKLVTLDDPPTAIMTVNDFYAFYAYSAITEAGKKVGKHISVVGFDDILMSQFLSPALTTVRCTTDTVADVAIELLFSRISDGAQPPKRIELPVNIVFRDSVAPVKRAAGKG